MTQNLLPLATVDLTSGPFEVTAIPDVFVVTPRRIGDERGFFSETFRQSWFDALGVEFVQDNHSLSEEPGTVRGLHFQRAPHAQDKLVRVVRGSAVDVAVDIRPASPTFGRHVMVTLSAENGKQMFVPAGFAHGFCTLQARTEVVYKVSAYYDAASDAGIRWNDPALGIPWPFEDGLEVVSDKDAGLPSLSEWLEAS